MATSRRRSPGNKSSKAAKKAAAFELTRVKLLYGLSGVFTLCVAGLLVARPTPLLSGTGSAVLAARVEDPIDSAIRTERALEPGVWKQIVVDRSDSLAGSNAFHFAVLPQATGDQLAVAAEWNRQVDFASEPGVLRVVLASADPHTKPRDVKTIQLLVERLCDRLRMNDADIVWR